VADIPEKAVRLAEFFRRLKLSSAVSDSAEAFRLIVETLNAVEDELTGIPYNPSAWMSDGRMYPPQPDSRRIAQGRPDLVRYVTKGHDILLGPSGAIEFRDRIRNLVSFRKPGADGSVV
jgi:hypothetical protein